MGVIVDRRELWFCRDCGAGISDDAVLAQLEAALTSPLGERMARTDSGYGFDVTLPQACGACGGGRTIFRPGKIG